VNLKPSLPDTGKEIEMGIAVFSIQYILAGVPSNSQDGH